MNLRGFEVNWTCIVYSCIFGIIIRNAKDVSKAVNFGNLSKVRFLLFAAVPMMVLVELFKC